MKEKTINTVDTAKVVKHIVEPVVTGLGYELVDVEYVREPSGMVLRLTIDKPGGVTLDDCVEVSHIAGDLLDVEDPIPGPYNLEVSSPGINRPLKRPADFQRFAGQKVYIKTREPIEGRRRFKGVLIGFEIKSGQVSVESGDVKFRIPFEQILKARLDIL